MSSTKRFLLAKCNRRSTIAVLRLSNSVLVLYILLLFLFFVFVSEEGDGRVVMFCLQRVIDTMSLNRLRC